MLSLLISSCLVSVHRQYFKMTGSVMWVRKGPQQSPRASPVPYWGPGNYLCYMYKNHDLGCVSYLYNPPKPNLCQDVNVFQRRQMWPWRFTNVFRARYFARYLKEFDCFKLNVEPVNFQWYDRLVSSGKMSVTVTVISLYLHLVLVLSTLNRKRNWSCSWNPNFQGIFKVWFWIFFIFL